MSKPWNPAGLMINQRVAGGLANRQIVYDSRFTGKTETLLAFIALTYTEPIILTDTVPMGMSIRNRWKTRYPLIKEPRFMSARQFVSRDGLSGSVLIDEIEDTDEIRERCWYDSLTFCGGVVSHRTYPID